jgi:hypothetical protein
MAERILFADRPSPLFSQGLPHVFRDFQLEARVIGLETGEPSIVPGRSAP